MPIPESTTTADESPEATMARVKAARRAQLEAQFGKGEVWDTDQLRAAFEVKGFCAGICVATRKSTGKVGSLDFDHSPRLYYAWMEDRK